MSDNYKKVTFENVFNGASTKLMSVGGQSIACKPSKVLNFLNAIASFYGSKKKFDKNSSHEEILSFFTRYKDEINERFKIIRITGTATNNLSLGDEIVNFLTNLNEIYNGKKIESNNEKYINIQFFLNNVINEIELPKEETMEKNNNYVTHEEFDPYAQKTDRLLGKINEIEKYLKNGNNFVGRDEVNSMLEEFQTELYNYVDKENTELSNNINLLQKQINDLNNSKNSTINNGQIIAIQNSLSAIRNDLSNLKKQVKNNEKNISKLQKESSEQKGEINKLKSLVEGLQSNTIKPKEVINILSNIKNLPEGFVKEITKAVNNNLIEDKRFIQLITDKINKQIEIKLEGLNKTLEELSNRIGKLEQQTKADKEGLDEKINKLENKGFNTWNEVHKTLEDIRVYFDTKEDFDNYKNELKNKRCRENLDINEQLTNEEIKNIKVSIKKKLNERKKFFLDKVKNLEIYKESLINNINEIRTKLENLKTQVDKNTKNIAEHANRLQDIEKKLNNLKIPITDENINEILGKLGADANTINLIIGKIDLNKGPLKKQITNILQTEREKILTEVDIRINAAKEELQEKITENTNNIEQINNEFNKFKTTIEGYKGDIEGLRKRIETEEQDRQNQYGELTKKINNGDQKLQSELNSLKEQIKALQTAKGKLEKSGITEEQVTNITKSLIDEYKKTVTKQITEINGKITTLQTNVNNLTNQQAQIQTKLNELEAQVKQNTEAIAELQKQKKEQDKRIKALEEFRETLEKKTPTKEEIEELIKGNELDDAIKAKLIAILEGGDINITEGSNFYTQIQNIVNEELQKKLAEQNETIDELRKAIEDEQKRAKKAEKGLSDRIDGLEGQIKKCTTKDGVIKIIEEYEFSFVEKAEFNNFKTEIENKLNELNIFDEGGNIKNEFKTSITKIIKEEVTKQITKINGKITTLQGDVQALKGQQTEIRTKLNELETQVKQNTEAIAELQKQKKEQDKRIKALEDFKETLENKTPTKKEIENLINNGGLDNAIKAKLITILNGGDINITEGSKFYTQIQDIVNGELKKELDKQNKTIDELRKAIEDEQKRAKGAEEELRGRINGLEGQIKKCTTKDGVIKIIGEYKFAFVKEEEFNNFKTEIENKLNELNIFDEDGNIINEKIKTNITNIINEEVTKQITEINGNITNLQNDVKTLTDQQIEIRTELNALKAQVNKNTEDIAELQKQKEEQDEEIKKLKEQQDQKNKEISNLNEEIKKLREEMENLKNKKGENADIQIEINNKLNLILKRNDELVNKITELTNINEELRKANEEYKKRCEKLEEEVEKLKKETKRLEEKKMDKEQYRKKDTEERDIPEGPPEPRNAPPPEPKPNPKPEPTAIGSKQKTDPPKPGDFKNQNNGGIADNPDNDIDIITHLSSLYYLVGTANNLGGKNKEGLAVAYMLNARQEVNGMDGIVPSLNKLSSDLTEKIVVDEDINDIIDDLDRLGKMDRDRLTEIINNYKNGVGNGGKQGVFEEKLKNELYGFLDLEFIKMTNNISKDNKFLENFYKNVDNGRGYIQQVLVDETKIPNLSNVPFINGDEIDEEELENVQNEINNALPKNNEIKTDIERTEIDLSKDEELLKNVKEGINHTERTRNQFEIERDVDTGEILEVKEFKTDENNKELTNDKSTAGLKYPDEYSPEYTDMVDKSDNNIDVILKQERKNFDELNEEQQNSLIELFGKDNCKTVEEITINGNTILMPTKYCDWVELNSGIGKDRGILPAMLEQMEKAAILSGHEMKDKYLNNLLSVTIDGKQITLNDVMTNEYTMAPKAAKTLLQQWGPYPIIKYDEKKSCDWQFNKDDLQIIKRCCGKIGFGLEKVQTKTNFVY